jgi:hypothetical protein
MADLVGKPPQNLEILTQHSFTGDLIIKQVNIITLWLFNIAMGNGPFIEVYLLKMVIFHGYVK